MHAQAGLYFLLALILAIGFLAVTIALPFFTPLALAAVFAVILQPVYRFFVGQMPRYPGLAAFSTVIFSILVILGPVSLVGLQIAREATEVYLSLAEGDGRAILGSVVENTEQFVGGYIPQAANFTDRVAADISTYAETGLQWVIAHAGGVFSGIVTTFLSLFLFLIALFYLLKDGAHFKRAIIEASPLRDRYDESLFARLELAINSVVRGNLSIALIQGVLSALGFTIFGVPNSILWGTVAALAALIPALGTGLVFLPIVGYLFFIGATGSAIGLAIWGILAVGLIDNLLGPRLIGSGIKLHPLVVLISVLGGIAFFGAVGVFLGPLSVSLLFALISIYTDLTERARV